MFKGVLDPPPAAPPPEGGYPLRLGSADHGKVLARRGVLLEPPQNLTFGWPGSAGVF
jgi:hypothetical protein